MLHALLIRRNGQSSSRCLLFLASSNPSSCPSSRFFFRAFPSQVLSHLSTGATLPLEKISLNDLLYELKNCTRKRDLPKGRELHKNAVNAGIDSNIYVAAALISFYAKCGSMGDAKTVFDSIENPDVVSWSGIILGYADNGQGSVALDLFSRMKEEGRCAPNNWTYVAALKACTLLAAGEAGKRECLERVRQIHSEIGIHMNYFAKSRLINLYGKCGSMEDAKTVFDSILTPDVVTWTAIILGYADNGQGSVALDLFSRMKDEGKCTPDSVTYVAALKACTLLAADGGEAEKRECLEKGRQIHSEIAHHHMDHFTQSTLINLYGKCGSMEDARTVFNSIREPNVVCWTNIILAYAENGQGSVAIDLFCKMKNEGRCAPNSVTYVAVLVACCSIGALTIGRRIHSGIKTREFNVRVVTCLVDFYAKCGNMDEARQVFDSHPQARNVSTWTALLAGYAQFGDTGSAFGLLEAMKDEGVQPDAVTFVCMLSCCSHAGLIEKAWEYLEVMPRYGVTPTVMHYSCMIDLLGRANKLDDAVALLQKMPCDPNDVTWTALLGACRKWKNAEIGRWAFKSLIDLDRKNARAYVLMAEIYGSRDMWEEQERVLEARMKFGACKLPDEKAYVIDGQARTIEFVAGEYHLADVEDAVREFLKTMKERGYVTESDTVVTKEKALCGHSERRAVVYGILNTSPGEVIRVVKNMRMCNECHSATKMISKFSGRVIMVRDDSRFHVMENGTCSCKDYF